MALLDSKQLNPKLTGSFTLSGSIQTFIGASVFSGSADITGSVNVSGNVSGSITSTGSFGYLNVEGDSVIAGNLTFGDADSDSVSFGADISSSLIPDVSNAYNIGSDGKRWNDFYLSGSVSASGGPHSIISATTIDLDAEGALTLDGGSITIGGDTDVAVDIDSTTLDIDASGALTLDSATSISIGTTADKPIDIDSTTLDIDASGAITIDGTSTFSIDVDGTTNINTSVGNIGIDSEAGSISIDGHTGVEVTSTNSGVVTIDGKAGVTIQEDGTDVIAIDTNRDVLFSQTGGSTSDPDVEFDGYTRFDGVAEVTLATQSTSTSTGALIIDGGAGIVKNLNVGGNISGSYTSTGSFGTLRVVDPAGININSIGTVSGSFTSTGSFGRVEAAGVVFADSFESVAGGSTIDFNDNVNLTGDLTATGNVSSSFTSTGSFGTLRVVDPSGVNINSVGTVSGSYTSTGSFGRLEVAETGSFGEVSVDGMTISSLTTFSSSVATKLNTIDADIIALSIALG